MKTYRPTVRLLSLAASTPEAQKRTLRDLEFVESLISTYTTRNPAEAFFHAFRMKETVTSRASLIAGFKEIL